MAGLGSGTVNAFLDAVAAQVQHAQDGLVPYGVSMAGIFAALGVMALGWSLWNQHASLVAPAARTTGACALVISGIATWPTVTLDVLRGSREVVGILTGGYDGPSTLFDMAFHIMDRMSAEVAGAVSLSPRTWWQAVIIGLSSIIIFLGLCLCGLLAVIAEFELLIGAACAPLILPFLCFPVTAPMGWGAVTSLVMAGVRVMVLGVTSYVLAQAATTVVGVPGTDSTLEGVQLGALMLVAVTILLMGFRANAIAQNLVAGVMGSLSHSSVTNSVASTVGGAVLASRGAGAVIGAGANLGGAVVNAARGRGSGGGGSSPGSGRVTRSSGSRSAFTRPPPTRVSMA